jgi:uncharacterized membrane protein
MTVVQWSSTKPVPVKTAVVVAVAGVVVAVDAAATAAAVTAVAAAEAVGKPTRLKLKRDPRVPFLFA